MAQPKALLAIGGAAVVAAAVVLVIAINKGDKADADSATEPTAVALQPGKPAPPSDPRGGPVITPGDKAEIDPDRKPLEYEMDGVKIRDHRKNPKPMEVPPNIHPPESRKIAPAIVGEFQAQVRRLAPECAKSLAPGDKGKGAKVTLQVVISIKDKQAKVMKSTAAITDVTSGVDAVKSCLETKAIGLVAAAPDEADLEDYSINLTMPL